MELNQMTVLELRKYAKENQIKLKAGLSKDGIISLITASIKSKEKAAPAQTEKPAPAAKAGDVKPAEPVYRVWHNPNPPRQKNQPGYGAHPAWQAKSSSAGASTQKTDTMGRTVPPPRPANFTPRFGPAAGKVVAPQPRREETYNIAPSPSHPIAPHPDASSISPVAPIASRIPSGDSLTLPELLQTSVIADGNGLLEVLPEGYGFLRDDNMQSTSKDIYVSAAQIRRFCLHTGDKIEGRTRPQRESDKYAALLYITKINGQEPLDTFSSAPAVAISSTPSFDSLTPVYPNVIFRLDTQEPVLQLINLLCPVALGQRGLVVGPRNSGKSYLLRAFVESAVKNENMEVQALLLSKRPEELAELNHALPCPVAGTTFDQSDETHQKCCDQVVDKVRRLAEQQKDVLLVVDNLNALFVPPAQASAFSPARSSLLRLLSVARCLKEGGSITLLAAVTNDGNAQDAPYLSQLMDAANMEITLEAPLSLQQFTPVVDMSRTFILHPECFLDQRQQQGLQLLKNAFHQMGNRSAMTQLYQLRTRARTKEELYTLLNDWIMNLSSKK